MCKIIDLFHRKMINRFILSITDHFLFHVYKHNPLFLQVFRVYIGSTLTNGIILEYNARQSFFEFIENPYGENYTIPILNLKINPDHSESSFDVLKAEGFKTIHLKAQNKLDQLLLQAIWKLNQKNYFSTPPDSNFVTSK